MSVLSHLISHIPLDCPSYAITAGRPKHFFFSPLELQGNIGLHQRAFIKPCSIFPHLESKRCNQSLFSFLMNSEMPVVVNIVLNLYIYIYKRTFYINILKRKCN